MGKAILDFVLVSISAVFLKNQWSEDFGQRNVCRSTEIFEILVMKDISQILLVGPLVWKVFRKTFSVSQTHLYQRRVNFIAFHCQKFFAKVTWIIIGLD